MKDSARLDSASLEAAVSLRPASAVDEAFLFDAYASTREEELAMVNLPEAQRKMFLDLQFKAETLSFRHRFPQADNLIILFNDKPIGRMLVNRTEDEVSLVDIALLPDYRSSGIGSWLIKGLQEEAKQRGRSVRLSVVQTNRAARLYERLGFTAVSADSVRLQMVWRPDSVENS